MSDTERDIMQGTRIDGRPDARERLGYVVAWEPDVDGMTVRDPKDVSPARFEAVGAFPTFETAHAFIRLIEREYGGYEGWVGHTSHPFRRIPKDGDDKAE